MANAPKNSNESTGGESAPDRWTSRILFAVSLATLLMLVVAIIEENVLSEWRWHQRDYRQLQANSGDAGQREPADDIRIELRQVDLPQFGTSDRCVTCHLGIDNPSMSDAAQPHRTHPGTILADHPTAEFGCTICHRGQGEATNFKEAKAIDVHWDYPLLPRELTESSCGDCHDPDGHLMARHAPQLASGRRLFVDRGCPSCHKLAGTGGQLGPALDGEGRKTRHELPMGHIAGEHTLANWLVQHFLDPQKIVAASRMPPPNLTPGEIRDLTTYMLSLQGRDLPQHYIAPDAVAAWNRRLHEPTLDGEVLYASHCMICHGDGTFGKWDPFFQSFIPAVRGPGLRTVADEAFLRSQVAQGRPGTIMPGWEPQAGGLSEEQLDALLEYLVGRNESQGIVPRPAPTSLAGGDADRGRQLFEQNCSACHGAAGIGGIAPMLANRVFLRNATDTLIAETIVNGRADTAMPSFSGADEASGLTETEIRDLLAYIRSLDSST